MQHWAFERKVSYAGLIRAQKYVKTGHFYVSSAPNSILAEVPLKGTV